MQASSHFVPKYSHYNDTNVQTVSESVCVCPSSNIVFTTFQLLLSDDFVHQSNKQLSQAATLKMKTPLVNINPSCSRQGLSGEISEASLCPLSPSNHTYTILTIITLVTSTSCEALTSHIAFSTHLHWICLFSHVLSWLLLRVIREISTQTQYKKSFVSNTVTGLSFSLKPISVTGLW